MDKKPGIGRFLSDFRRPDLVATALAVEDAGGGQTRLRITIRNSGAAPCDPAKTKSGFVKMHVALEGGRGVAGDTAVAKLKTRLDVGKDEPIVAIVPAPHATLKSAGGTWVVTVDVDDEVAEQPGGEGAKNVFRFANPTG